jgi:ribonuclease HI
MVKGLAKFLWCITTLRRFGKRLIVPGLRQLNNRFELLAIRAGLDYALKKRLKNFVIYSDSKVAVGWSKHPKVRWLPREENLAGHIFEARSYPQSIT